ncbi:MAG: hypothetical protein RR410_04850 [Alistipes sp.]
MKKLIFILAAVACVAVALVACDNDDNKIWDANAMVSLRAAKGVRASANPDHLSALEIVKQTNDMAFWCPKYYPGSIKGLYRGFSEAQRDFVNERLLMWGDDIITAATGELSNAFIAGEDIVLRRIVNLEKDIVDTIAYIPNSILRTAEVAIREAYAAKNYATVYKLFDTAFTFMPITGDEWRELKRQGLN